MMRRKNLERAIFLGLLLSTSVNGSAWAEAPNVEIIKTDEFVQSEAVTNPWNGNTEIKDGYDLVVNTDKVGVGIGYNGIVNVVDGDLTVNSSSNSIQSGYSENAEVKILANNVTLNAGTNGIFTTTESGYASTVILGSEDRNITGLTINAGGQGIDNKNGNVYIYGSDNSIIYIASNKTSGEMENQAAINNAVKDGIVTVNGGSITLSAVGGNGITNGEKLIFGVVPSGVESTTTLNSNKVTINASVNGIYNNKGTTTLNTNGTNSITADKNAVYNHGSGTITISATAGTGDEAISKLANDENYNNELVGGENGVQSDSTGTTNVIADNDNVIAGTKNGILSDGAGTITVTAGNNNTIGQYTDAAGTHTSVTGIRVTEGTVNVTANNNNEIYGSSYGIYSDGDKEGETVNKISLTSNEGSNIINTNNQSIGYGIYAVYTDEVKLTAKQDNVITLIGNAAGINSIGSIVELIAQEGSNKVSANGEGNTSWGVQSTTDGYVKLDAEKDNEVSGVYNAILAQSKYSDNEAKVVLVAGGNNTITADEVAIQACYDGNIELTAETGNNIVKGNNGKNLQIGLTTEKNGGSTREDGGIISLTAANNNDVYTDYLGIHSIDNGQISLSAGNSNFITGDYGAVASYRKSSVSISATNGDNEIISIGLGEGYALDAESGSTISTNAVRKDNKIISDSLGIYAGGNGSQVSATAGTDNIITADSQNMLTDDTLTANYGYGNSYAVYSEAGAAINLQAVNANKVSGAVYANGSGTDAEDNVVPTSVILDAAENNVYSAAVIDGAGDIDTSEGSGNKFAGKQFVSSLYAEDGAHIELTGENRIGTWADNEDENTLERTVWAYSQDDNIASSIKITGAAQIGTDRYEISPNSADVAIAAGTATNLDKEKVDGFNGERSIVTVEYDNFADGSISSISGDILSAYAGQVDIYSNNDEARINVNGNLLAGNNGVLNVDLGNGGRLTGRVDDYGDAGVVENSGHGTVENDDGKTFYNPAFSSDIFKGGEVTLNMGDGSQWNVQGQSWITNVNTNGNVKIDLTNVAEEYQNYNSHALTIRNLNGDANIKMDLNGDRSQSDMLYIGQGNGEYNIELAELVTVDDMYANLDDNTKFSGLRFATVGAGSDVKFNVTAKDQGFNNVIYTVDTDVYNSAESAHENDAYNGENMTEEKPGNSLVDDLLNGKQNASTESGIATLAANDVMLLADENNTENDNKTQHLNYKLVDMQSDGPTDAGKTMLNMSRANYSNAIYMDRLNKRLGEARYINDDPEEDEGMWVRIRHDRIGKEDAFRSQNTMYELGYDKRQECDNGKRRVGFAVDYMHGDTGYSDIAGKGEIDRYGLWLYDTWTGNKGHYADYVAKWGHLQNDFEVYTMTGGEKVTGDYSNNVFSISAEYGRKKDMGNDWYIEPQAQLQLARVTGADYTTSQGTKVSVDGINSLIGRAGFRLGKDFGEEKQSTVYFKADVLHEFLGDQTIRAMDGTTDGWQTVDYENKGTWYDIGIGYAAMLSQSTYAFIDLEQSFGNDNDDTYQINAGVRWTF